MGAVAATTYLPDQTISGASPIDGLEDRELLERYLGGGRVGESAFAELVRRHVDMVYAAARRQLGGDAHLAEDVTQAVFTVLARRALRLDRRNVLVGWLYNTARYCAANARKIEARRKHHEAKGGAMDRIRRANQARPRTTGDEDERAAEALPHLDAALSSLSSRDRDAVLLKYIAGKTHKAVGEALGVTEEAARKRVDRAVEKLRGFFIRRGVGVSAMAVTGLLATASTEAAPAGLAATIASSAALAGAGTSTAAIADGAILTMLLAKVKVAAAILIAIAAVGTTGALAARYYTKAAESQGRTAQVPRRPAPGGQAAVAGAIPKAGPPRTSTIAGVVKSALGEPVAGARVQIATNGNNVRVYDDKPSGAREATTTDDGSFVFDVGGAPAYVVVRHELGFAQATREQLAAANGVITLRPWGRIEGVAKVAGQPAADAQVTVGRMNDWNNPYSRMLDFERKGTTDAQGRFSFDRVVAGDTWVGLVRRDPVPHPVLIRFVELEPGKAARVDLGGSGRPLVGRFSLPAGSDERIVWAMNQRHSFVAGLSVNAVARPAPPTASRADWGEQMYEELRARSERWLATPAGRRYQQTRANWSLWIEPDGSFRIEDVPAGTHKLFVQAYVSEGGGILETLAEGERYFSVPEMEGGRSDEPLDLGTTFLKPQQRLRLGKPAPDFAAKSLDGKDVKPSDFRGKMLVLYFFSAGQSPDERQVAQLKLVHEKNAKDVALLGVNFGDDPQFTKQLVERHGLKWPHATSRFGSGMLDALRGTGIPPQYNAYPSRVFLIDPQGNVIARNIAGDEIEAAVYRALFER